MYKHTHAHTTHTHKHTHAHTHGANLVIEDDVALLEQVVAGLVQIHPLQSVNRVLQPRKVRMRNARLQVRWESENDMMACMGAYVCVCVVCVCVCCVCVRGALSLSTSLDLDLSLDLSVTHTRAHTQLSLPCISSTEAHTSMEGNSRHVSSFSI